MVFKVGDVARVEHFHLEPPRDRRVNRVVDASALNVPRLFQTGPVIFQEHGPGDGAGAVEQERGGVGGAELVGGGEHGVGLGEAMGIRHAVGGGEERSAGGMGGMLGQHGGHQHGGVEEVQRV